MHSDAILNAIVGLYDPFLSKLVDFDKLFGRLDDFKANNKRKSKKRKSTNLMATDPCKVQS